MSFYLIGEEDVNRSLNRLALVEEGGPVAAGEHFLSSMKNARYRRQKQWSWIDECSLKKEASCLAFFKSPSSSPHLRSILSNIMYVVGGTHSVSCEWYFSGRMTDGLEPHLWWPIILKAADVSLIPQMSVETNGGQAVGMAVSDYYCEWPMRQVTKLHKDYGRSVRPAT